MNIENPTIQDLINAFLIMIPVGAAARAGFCVLSTIHDEEERGKNIRRAKNAVYFGIVAEVAVVIINLAYNYFG